MALVVTTALVVAGQHDMVRLHGSLGLLVDEPLADKLYCATNQGDARTVAHVLYRRPDMVDTRRYGDRTLLHEAAWAGSGPVIRTLIRHGASVDAQDADGNTPLHIAAGASEPASVALLLKARANVNARNRAGDTPLDCAKRLICGEIAAALRRHGGLSGSALRNTSVPRSGHIAAGNATRVHRHVWRAVSDRLSSTCLAGAQAPACARVLLRGHSHAIQSCWAFRSGNARTDTVTSPPLSPDGFL